MSGTGSAIAGLSYAFGGVVLSDYFNIIYLVGAAWLPLGFRAADRWLRLGLRSGLVELAVVLAMQVLGGDPEAAYLTVLCAFGYALGLARSPGGSPARPWRWGLILIGATAGWIWAGPRIVPGIHRSGGAWGQAILTAVWGLGLAIYLVTRRRGRRARVSTMLLGLAASCTLALSLSAVQLLPVLEHIAASVRWEGAGLEDLYDSSLLPYRVVEWIWPNVFGTFTAGNHYWMPLLPPVGGARPSPMSLYCGALPIVLALGASGFRAGLAVAGLDDRGRSPEFLGGPRRVRGPLRAGRSCRRLPRRATIASTA